MPAAAPAAKKPAAKKKSSTSSARKSTAASSHKPSGDGSAFGEAVDELRDKRAEFTQPIVDTPVAVVGTGEVETQGEKTDNIEIVPLGSSVIVSIGGKSVTLDREGFLSLGNQVRRISVGM